MSNKPTRCLECGKFTVGQALYCKNHVDEEISALKGQLEAANTRITELEAINRQHQALVDSLRSDIAALVELTEHKGLWARFTRLLRLQI